MLISTGAYFTSSKTTLTDYQCVSTGCCTHVAKTEITIDNQHVTNIIAKVQISPQTTKRKHRKKSQTCYIFFDLELLCHIKIAVESPTEVYAPIIVYHYTQFSTYRNNYNCID